MALASDKGHEHWGWGRGYEDSNASRPVDAFKEHATAKFN